MEFQKLYQVDFQKYLCSVCLNPNQECSLSPVQGPHTRSRPVSVSVDVCEDKMDIEGTAHEITTLEGNHLQGSDSISGMKARLLIWSHPHPPLLPFSVCGTRELLPANRV